MSRPALSASPERLLEAARAELHTAYEAVQRANRLLGRSGSDLRYGVLIADTQHSGLFLEPAAAGEVA